MSEEISQVNQAKIQTDPQKTSGNNSFLVGLLAGVIFMLLIVVGVLGYLLLSKHVKVSVSMDSLEGSKMVESSKLPVKDSGSEDGEGFVKDQDLPFNPDEDGLVEEEDVVIEKETTGKIRGSFSYPSEQIPPEMLACAEPVGGGEPTCTDTHLTGDEFGYGQGFEIETDPGKYYVYAFLPDSPDYKAYYNEFVTCGLSVDCTSRKNIEVEVSVGETTSNVQPHDWYAPQE